MGLFDEMVGWNAHTLWEEEDSRHRQRQEYCRQRAWAQQVEQTPDEVWLEIFRHVEPNQLLQVRAVCHRFRRLAEDSSVWIHWATLQWGTACQARSPTQYFGWVRHHAYTHRHLTELGALVERMRQDEASWSTLPPTSVESVESAESVRDPRAPVRCGRCGKAYVGALNHGQACVYHPQLYHWSLQHWSCCTLPRTSPGCQRTSHLAPL